MPNASTTLHDPVIVVVSGDPGSGKTTIAMTCARELGIPVLSRDAVKETMFDTLGWSDRDWSQRVGGASFELMFYFLKIMVDSRASVILDCNLSSPSARATLREILSDYPHLIVEVVCRADPDVARDRFDTRALSGNRHPGHVDAGNLDEFHGRIGTHPCEPVVPNSHHVIVDTSRTDEMVASSEICSFIRRCLA